MTMLYELQHFKTPQESADYGECSAFVITTIAWMDKAS